MTFQRHSTSWSPSSLVPPSAAFLDIFLFYSITSYRPSYFLSLSLSFIPSHFLPLACFILLLLLFSLSLIHILSFSLWCVFLSFINSSTRSLSVCQAETIDIIGFSSLPHPYMYCLILLNFTVNLFYCSSTFCCIIVAVQETHSASYFFFFFLGGVVVCWTYLGDNCGK